MPYTKTALNRLKKDELVNLYMIDQQKFNDHDKTVKELQTKLAQSENHNKTIVETHHLKINEDSRKYKVKISQLEKELSEFKNTGNNPSLIRNLQSANAELREQLENYKKNELARETFMVEKYDMLESLKTENTQYRMEIDKLKDDLHLSKASHKRLTEKEQQRDKLITQLFDLK